LILLGLSLILIDCKKDNPTSVNGQIGSQVWTTQNLDVETFRNGDTIPQAQSDQEWTDAGQNGQPAWCYFDNDPTNGTTYGKLYNWFAVNDVRGLAPAGWHIPTEKEWTILTDFLGGAGFAGKEMKSTNGWADNGNGTNSSSFSGLPGGNRSFWGSFTDLGSIGGWWSATEYSNPSLAWYRNLNKGKKTIYPLTNHKRSGFSVRCVKD